MHFMKKYFFFVTALAFCMLSADAHESKCIFIGQNGANAVFTLEIIGDLPGDHIQIDPNGEVHIKVDKINVVPQETVSQFSFEGHEQDCSSNVASRTKKWQCPYCHMWWEYGERCKNQECPTNR